MILCRVLANRRICCKNIIINIEHNNAYDIYSVSVGTGGTPLLSIIPIFYCLVFITINNNTFICTY